MASFLQVASGFSHPFFINLITGMLPMFCRRPDLDETNGGDQTTLTWEVEGGMVYGFCFQKKKN
jgi:hypothetical protein